ncbi:hypothetical protein [Aestuariivivens sediminicola]|uniref:hypothetical protein n=1 Tax=Aestuariivivens sediminicola TaxID=2913560 RepID=UPI001F587C3B|nr:hypothetical protein [Aestuariivivens sediminicola]
MILYIVLAILVTIGLVWLIDKYIPSKLRPVVMIVLWVVIGFLAYNTFMSVYKPIQFNQIKNKRYAQVIKNLIDIRDAQLAHKQVTGQFADNFDNLVSFIDTAQFTITQRRDTSVLDVEMTRRFGGVETFKDEVIIDTLGFVSVKDSLFGDDSRYKTMMNVPAGEEGAKFELKAGFLDQNDIKIPVFEASVKKAVILIDQDKDLVNQENQVVSVEAVNGDAIKVGSMEEVNTNGNWPKTYGSD